MVIKLISKRLWKLVSSRGIPPPVFCIIRENPQRNYRWKWALHHTLLHVLPHFIHLYRRRSHPIRTCRQSAKDDFRSSRQRHWLIFELRCRHDSILMTGHIWRGKKTKTKNKKSTDKWKCADCFLIETVCTMSQLRSLVIKRCQHSGDH